MRGWRPYQNCELEALCLSLAAPPRSVDLLPIRDQCSTCVTDAPDKTRSADRPRRIPVNVLPCHDGPDDPGELVGQGDGGQHPRFTCEHPGQP